MIVMNTTDTLRRLKRKMLAKAREVDYMPLDPTCRNWCAGRHDGLRLAAEMIDAELAKRKAAKGER